jgi:CCR4-NOT transcription complex subunit 9
MQHAVFPHQNPYQPDWQHHQHAQTHHQYAQTQAAAAANAVAQQQQQQQHYGRMNQNNGNVNGGNSMAPGLAGVDGRDLEHGPGSMIPGGDAQISEDNRKVLDWIAQVLNASTREGALLELSKKREQVPELALILWHSFGKM